MLYNLLLLLLLLLSPPALPLSLPTSVAPPFPLVVGVTGPIGSGKSSLCSSLASSLNGTSLPNLPPLVTAHIEADKLASYPPGSPLHASICDAFPSCAPGGVLDRSLLSDLAFADPPSLSRLNALVWPAVTSQLRSLLSDLPRSPPHLVLLEAAPLVPAGWADGPTPLCSSLISVTAPPPVRAARVASRNSLPLPAAELRVAAQSDADFGLDRAGAIRVENSADLPAAVAAASAAVLGVLQSLPAQPPAIPRGGAAGISLEKPLGLLLEERDDGGPGAVVAGVAEEGSAVPLFESGEIRAGQALGTVAGVDVSGMGFDDVMDVLIGAESPLEIAFADAEEEGETEEGEGEEGLPQGTPVSVTVTKGGAPLDLGVTAAVGDVLLKRLKEAKAPVYTGMAKMTNCGGMGQCLTCKVVLTEPDGQTLYERSEYEDAKLAKFPSNVRLACMTLVEGDVRVDLP